jgi:RimJ/RimL family protein N-acetyltransferase
VPALRHPEPPLSDGVVALRAWRRSDRGAIVAMCSDPLSARFTNVPEPYGEADADAWLASHDEGIAAGSSMPFAVVRAQDDRVPVGSMGLVIDWHHRRAEVGYLMDPAARGHGWATRAVALACDWALDDLGLDRIELLAEPENRASRRVAVKAGFRREGVLRAYRLVKGRRVDLVVFSLLPDDRIGRSAAE